MPPVTDYYRVLQVDRSAPIEAIEASYRRLAREAHPDLNDSPDATKRMQALNEARAVLRDPLKRAAFDATLTPVPAPVPRPAPPPSRMPYPAQAAPPQRQPAPGARPPPPARARPRPSTPVAPRPAPTRPVEREKQRDRADAVRARMADDARRESAVLGWGSIGIFAGWAVLLINLLPPMLGEVSAGTMAALLGVAVVLTLPFGYALDQLLGRRRSRGQIVFVGLSTYFGLVAATYVSGGLILLMMPSRPAIASADIGLVLILGGLMALIHFVVAYGLHRRTRAGQIGALALATGGVIAAVLLLRAQPTWAGAALALNAALIVATISLEP
jgi:hypothetical protein